MSGEDKNKMVAGLLAIFLGGWGIHKFYLGYTKEGVIQLVASLITCGIAGIIPLIEGIMYLTASDEDFQANQGSGNKPWF